MGKWEMVRLGDVLSDTIIGEWGEECKDAYGVKVLRTTNFTNKGVIDYSNVVVRDIPATKIVKKKLLPYDIILEKSGGSDNQPVGRVVYFDKSDDIYLCNNFTQILRVNSEIVNSKYIFYCLLNLHRIGVTELLQNKTTGIRNLQVKSYMALEIPLPPLPIQQKIADVLDRASALIEKRKAQIEKLDLLVKSHFIEMFGDPVKNPMGWEVRRLGEVFEVRSSKRVYQSEQTNNGVPFLRVSDLTSRIINGVDSCNLHIAEGLYDTYRKAGHVPKTDDVLVTSRGTLGLCYIVRDTDKFYFQDGMISWLSKNDVKVGSYYIMCLFCTGDIKRQIERASAGSTVGYLSLANLESLSIMFPPYLLQTQFSAFVERVEAQKVKMKQGLELMELEYKSLMQKCFNGETSPVSSPSQLPQSATLTAPSKRGALCID